MRGTRADCIESLCSFTWIDWDDDATDLYLESLLHYHDTQHVVLISREEK